MNLKQIAQKIGGYLQSKTQDDEGLVRGGKFTPVQQTKEYFTPTSNAGQNFWSTPVAKGLGNLQTIGENFVRNPLPTFNIKPENSNLVKVSKTIGNIVPQTINSVVGKGILSPLTDVAQMGLSRFGGTSPTYDTMRSGAGRLGLQLAGKVNPDTISQYGTKYGFKQTAGNIASTAMPIIDAYTPKAGTQLVKEGIKQFSKQGLINVIKQGFTQGTLLGGLSGLTQSLSDSRNIQDNKNYAENVILGTSGGAIIGGVAGGVLSGLSHGMGYIFNGIKQQLATKNPKLSSQQVEQEAIKIVKDKAKKPVEYVTKFGSPDLIYNDNTGNWDIDPKWIKKQSGAIDLNAKVELPKTDQPIKTGTKIPTYSEASDLIQKEGGFANLKSLPTTNRYAAEQIGGSLGLNPKYLYEEATKKGINLDDYLKRIDAEVNPNTKIEIGNELISNLSPESKGIKITETPKIKLSDKIPTKIIPEVQTKTTELNSITDPVQKMITALKEAKPLRGQQEALYSKARSQKFAKLMSARGKSGEKGYFAELGSLKGEMPKVQFESLRNSLNQSDIDTLFDRVKNSNIGDWEKINAQTGLSKILGSEGGAVPTKGELSLLNEVFGKEFTQTLLDKRSLMQKVMATVGDVLNVPRALMSSFDLSAPFRQGVFLIGRPKQFVPAFKSMLGSFGSEKAYNSVLDEITSRPTYKVMRDSKLAITKPNNLLSQGEESFMSNFAEKIPGIGKIVGASDRAYSGFLNKLRADTFDDILNKSKDLGIPIDKTLTDSLADFVNSATGRGKLPGKLANSAQVLNGLFFSPRLMASRLNLLNPVYYAKLDPTVRKEALKSLFTFAATGMTVATLAKLGGAEVGTDPRSSDFGKIKIGNTRYDPWGGFQQYIKAASQLISGKLISSTTGKEYTLGEGYKPITRFDIATKFLESKEAPVASFITSLLKGETALGDKFDLTTETINRLTPMMMQDIYDLAKEWGPKGLLMGIPGIFGIGSQTYGKQIPIMETTAAGNQTVKFKSQPGLTETLVNKIKGTPVSNIPEEQWQGLIQSKNTADQLNLTKEKLKKSVGTEKVGQTTTDVIVYPTSEGVKTLDLTKYDKINNLPKSNKYESAIRESKQFTSAGTILDNQDLTDEQKTTALKRLGIDEESAKYYQIANDNTNLKTMYVMDKVQSSTTKQELIDSLSSLRKQVNGQMVASNAVLDNLVDEGILSKAEATNLKKYKFENNTLVPIKKSTGSGKKAKKITFKVSSPKALPKITLKISSPVSRVKLKSAPKIKLSKTDNRKYTIKA